MHVQLFSNVSFSLSAGIPQKSPSGICHTSAESISQTHSGERNNRYGPGVFGRGYVIYLVENGFKYVLFWNTICWLSHKISKRNASEIILNQSVQLFPDRSGWTDCFTRAFFCMFLKAGNRCKASFSQIQDRSNGVLFR